MILDYAYTADEEKAKATRPVASSATRERMRARMKAARPFLTESERKAAEQHLPHHIFQAVDVETPKLD